MKKMLKILKITLLSLIVFSFIACPPGDPLAPLKRNLSIEAIGNGTFEPAAQSEWSEEEKVELRAIPAEGWEFVRWELNEGSDAHIVDKQSAQTIIILRKTDARLLAYFSSLEYSLYLSAGSGGSVSPVEPVVLTPDDRCCIVIAIPDSGSQFSHWEKLSGPEVTFADANAPTTEVCLSGGDVSLRAVFTASYYTLDVVSDPQGHITEPTEVPVFVPHDTWVFVEAEPHTGYKFKQWLVDSGSSVEIDTPFAKRTGVKLTGGNATVRATYELDLYKLTVTSDKGGSIVLPASSPIDAPHGLSVDIRAQADTCYRFVRWSVVSGDGVTINNPASLSTSVILSGGNAAVTAEFALIQYTINASAGPGGSITPNGPVIVNCDSDRTFNFDLNPCSNSIANVIVDGVSQGAVSSYTFRNVRANHTIHVEFSVKKYKLIIQTIGDSDTKRLDNICNYDSGGTATSPLGNGQVQVNCGEPLNISADSVMSFQCYDDIPPNGDVYYIDLFFAGWRVRRGSVTFAISPSGNTTVTVLSDDAFIYPYYE